MSKLWWEGDGVLCALHLMHHVTLHVTWNETLCRYSPENRRNAPEAYPHIWFSDDTEKVCTRPQFSPPAPEVLPHERTEAELRLNTAKNPASFQKESYSHKYIWEYALRGRCYLLSYAEKTPQNTIVSELPAAISPATWHPTSSTGPQSQNIPQKKKKQKGILCVYCYWWIWLKNTP